MNMHTARSVGPSTYNRPSASLRTQAEAGSPSMASRGVLKPRPTFFQYRLPALPGVMPLAAFLALKTEPAIKTEPRVRFNPAGCQGLQIRLPPQHRVVKEPRAPDLGPTKREWDNKQQTPCDLLQEHALLLLESPFRLHNKENQDGPIQLVLADQGFNITCCARES